MSDDPRWIAEWDETISDGERTLTREAGSTEWREVDPPPDDDDDGRLL